MNPGLTPTKSPSRHPNSARIDVRTENLPRSTVDYVLRDDRLVRLRDGFQSPSQFATRASTAWVIEKTHLVKSPQELMRSLTRISELLGSTELDSLIDEGKITLGLIKPKANQSKNLGSTDELAAMKISERLGVDDVILNLNFKLTKPQVARWYQENEEAFRKKPCSDNRRADENNLWEELIGFMSRGPVTFLLIAKEANAVKWLMDETGHTFPSKAGPKTVRGEFGMDAYQPNNLLHRSDSIEAVRTEVRLLKSYIDEFLSKVSTIN